MVTPTGPDPSSEREAAGRAEGAPGSAARPERRPPADGPAGASAPPGLATPSGVEWLGTWTRVVLGLLLGIGMTQWPYAHGCGFRLMFYLLGVVVVFGAGVWSSLSSWKRRLGVAHVLAQILILWGLVLAARVLLPRVGYAKQSAPWFCRSEATSPL